VAGRRPDRRPGLPRRRADRQRDGTPAGHHRRPTDPEPEPPRRGVPGRKPGDAAALRAAGPPAGGVADAVARPVDQLDRRPAFGHRHAAGQRLARREPRHARGRRVHLRVPGGHLAGRARRAGADTVAPRGRLAGRGGHGPGRVGQGHVHHAGAGSRPPGAFGPRPSGARLAGAHRPGRRRRNRHRRRHDGGAGPTKRDASRKRAARLRVGDRRPVGDAFGLRGPLPGPGRHRRAPRPGRRPAAVRSGDVRRRALGGRRRGTSGRRGGGRHGGRHPRRHGPAGDPSRRRVRARRPGDTVLPRRLQLPKTAAVEPAVPPGDRAARGPKAPRVGGVPALRPRDRGAAVGSVGPARPGVDRHGAAGLPRRGRHPRRRGRQGRVPGRRLPVPGRPPRLPRAG